MSARLFTLMLAVAIPAFSGAGAAPPAPRAAVADTILRVDLDRPAGAVRLGLTAAEGEPGVMLGLRRIRLVPGAPLGATRPSVTLVQGAPGARDSIALEPLADAAIRWRVAGLATGGADSAPFLPRPPSTALAGAGAVPGRFVTDYADLALNVRSRMELGGNWTRFRPCVDQFRESCNPSAIPQLFPEVLFGVQIDGSIANRISVDVDFDQAREFDAANRINIVYEGHEDDLLQRLEVGDVNFALPRSRYLTEGIPSGNFGFQAAGQIGAVDFQGVWAQQRGDLNSRVFQLSGIGDQRGFVQEDTLVLDDADYVRGQFFFLLDPTQIEGYPHIDVLQLDAAAAPASLEPGAEPIQLYRLEDDPAFQQQVEGFIQADAVADAGGQQVVESGWFRYLQEGLDYFVHPSGLWLALRAPLSREEMLAVTYITAAGDTIGDYNPERIHNAGARPTLRLLKASGANHQPGRPTWDQEMHQIYRVSGTPDVEAASVELIVSLGELSAGRTFKRRPSGEDITFLRLFGLDEEAPLDGLDPSFVYTPGGELFADEPPVQGAFVVFPTLRPFAEPPPVPSLDLSAGEVGQILGEDANPRIYYEEDPFERDNAGRFRLTLAYRLRSEGLISSFSLGAFGIRDGSEQVFLGDRLLARGIDYEIDYDVGQVRLLEPDLLFAAMPDASVRVSWEQRSLFQVSPTEVFGLRTHADLGDGGGIDLLGLYQSERTVVSRPILGTEPSAALLGGLSGSYRAGLGFMNGMLEAVPGLTVEGESALSMSGEIAVSVPNPNRRDRAFVDDFDSSAQIPVSLTSPTWLLGSAPTSRDGAESVLPPTLDPSTAATLVWQHSWIIEGAGGDSIGVHEGFYPQSDIDRQIRVAGSEVREPALRLSFGPPATIPSAWRSITTTLSTNGMDLTKTEFLEVYVSGSPTFTLVIDLGTVSEDAYFIDSGGNTSGPRADGGQWGLGLLDQEADPRRGQIWSDATDALGVWGESCTAERGRIYRVGDPTANCTRGNGRPDSEDLDSDGNLDVAERHLRYVLPLDGTSPYLKRTSAETGTNFQLYRIPIREGVPLSVGGPFTEADLRAVRHLRMTVVGPAGVVQVARMRLVGSRWIKRNGDGVLRGIAGDTLSNDGRVEVSSVSRLTEGAAYSSPPGVLEELDDPTAAYAGQGVEYNEKSLGISFEDLPPLTRAEVYQRFPQRPRDFLSYGEARFWVVARQGDFGEGRPNQFFFKVGSDSENFYLYRTAVPPPASPAGVMPADWLPEIRVDFQRWYALRLEAEALLSTVPPAPGDPPLEVWSADSTYAVVLKDRGRAPNLAAVREISMGVWNAGMLPTSGEVWVNELRLAAAVKDPGIAGTLDVGLEAGGVLTSRLTLSNRGAFFRQLRDNASYQTDRSLAFTSTLALDRWLPSAWGMDVPLTVDLSRSSQAPYFLQGSDVRANLLPRLRPTEQHRTRVGAALRKRVPTANPWLGFVLDGLDANASYTKSDGSTVTTEYDSDVFDAGVGWVREPDPVEVSIVPNFADGLVRALLPGFLEDLVADARLRLTPERVSLGASYYQQDSRIFRFEQIIQDPNDANTVPTLVPREALQAAADVRMRPLNSLTAGLAILSTRDLLSPEEAVADPRVQALIQDERASFAGMDLGWETHRALRTSLAYRPVFFSWLRNDFDWTSVYDSERNSNLVNRMVVDSDTTLALARSARAERDWGLTVALDPSRLAIAWFGESPGGGSPELIGSLMSAVRPISVAYRDGITSRFNRDPIDPGLGYQLGFGDTDSFRYIDGATAATLTDRYSWRLGTGLNLPTGASLQVGYQWTDAMTLDTRSDRRTRLESWPQVQASLPTFVPPSNLGIQSINVSSGFERTQRTIEFGGRAAQRRFDEDIRIPVNVSVQWQLTLVTGYQASFRMGRGQDPTGETDRDEWSHRVSITSQLLPVGFFSGRLDRPVSLSILGALSSERICRNTTAQDECIDFVDQTRRTLNVSLETGVRGFSVGLQASFDDRQSHVGQLSGSTLFQVGIFGQLDLSGGSLPFG